MSNIGRILSQAIVDEARVLGWLVYRYGYCDGYFGRDHIGACRVEAEGFDWIVVRREDGVADFTNFTDEEEKTACIKRWSEQP